MNCTALYGRLLTWLKFINYGIKKKKKSSSDLAWTRYLEVWSWLLYQLSYQGERILAKKIYWILIFRNWKKCRKRMSVPTLLLSVPTVGCTLSTLLNVQYSRFIFEAKNKCQNTFDTVFLIFNKTVCLIETGHSVGLM